MAKSKCLKLKKINFYNRETHLLLYPLAKDKIVPQSTLLNIHENPRVQLRTLSFNTAIHNRHSCPERQIHTNELATWL